MKQRKLQRILLLLVLLCGMLPQTANALDFHEEAGGLNILKTDAEGIPLPGAVFRIAREATQEEREDPDCSTEQLTVDDRQIEVVYESFYSDSSLRGRLLWEAETDGQGKTAMYGLPHGTHYLVESEAPEGCNRITVPVRVSVNKYSHLTANDMIRDDAGVIIDNTIHIINLRHKTPDTGRPVTFLRIMGAVSVISSVLALLLLIQRRRR